MDRPRLHPRHVRRRLIEALRDTPAVLIHGPRQCGKTTLALEAGRAAGYAYYSFDDDNVAAAARQDPVGFAAALPRRAILDEVQRVPGLFASLKLAIDRDRRPGRFILAGSTNVLLVPKLADSLAGRMEIVRLHPLAQCELERARPRFLDALFERRFAMRTLRRRGPAIAERVAAGGYPAALARPAGRRRREWHRAYLDTLVQRDVRDLARLGALDALPKLLQLAAGQTARLLNASELAAPFQVSRPTIRAYVTVLERIFVLELLPPWHRNRLSRLVKAPKLHVGDAGLAAALLGADSAAAWTADPPLFGQLLETFAYGELRRQASWHADPLAFHHYRDKDGFEVDIVIERGASQVAGVEVKASGTVGERDFRGLRKLREAAGEGFAAGVVLYDGEDVLPAGERLFAVPLHALWSRP